MHALWLTEALSCRFERRIPAQHADKGTAALQALSKEVAPLLTQYVSAMDRIRMREALKVAMSISSLGNRFIQVRLLCNWGATFMNLLTQYVSAVDRIHTHEAFKVAVSVSSLGNRSIHPDD